LLTLVRARQKTAISQHDFSSFVSTDPQELEYDAIEKQILASVQDDAAKLYGIQVVNVGMERLALPQRITETVFEAMKKERQTEAAKYTSTGESQATTIKSQAEGIANTILSFADRKAQQIVDQGLARAAELYHVFQQDQELASFLLKIENLPKILKEPSTTVVLDKASPVLDVLFPGGSTSTQPAQDSSGAQIAGRALPPEMVRPGGR
jgi:membrane protease subunit HflC